MSSAGDRPCVVAPAVGDWLNGRALPWGGRGYRFDSCVPDRGRGGFVASVPGYSSIGRALGSGPRGSQFKPEYPDHFRASNLLTRLSLTVKGVVQGVGFRWFVYGRAEDLGLSGWVRNREDGTVEAEVEGEEPVVNAFLGSIRRDHPAARVDSIESRPVAARGDRGFVVR